MFDPVTCICWSAVAFGGPDPVAHPMNFGYAEQGTPHTSVMETWHGPIRSAPEEVQKYNLHQIDTGTGYEWRGFSAGHYRNYSHNSVYISKDVSEAERSGVLHPNITVGIISGYKWHAAAPMPFVKFTYHESRQWGASLMVIPDTSGLRESAFGIEVFYTIK